MKNRTCCNCGTRTKGNYCPQCGQRLGEARLSWAVLWEGTMSTFLGEGFDGEKGMTERYGVLGTLWQILRHPVRTVTGFLEGHRRRYFNPITLLLALSGLFALFSAMFGTKLFEIPAFSAPEGFSNLLKTINNYAETHPATYLLAATPFSALSYKWIFRPRKLRYIEFLYIGIFTSIFSIVTLFILSVFPAGTLSSVRTWTDSLPEFCVQIAVFRRIFGHGIPRTAINLLIGYGLGMLLLIISIIPVAMLIGIVYRIFFMH